MQMSYGGVDRRCVELLVSHVAPSQIALGGAELALLGQGGTPRVSWESVLELVQRVDQALGARDPGWAVRTGSLAVPDARGFLGSLLLNAPSVGVALATAVEVDSLVQSAYSARWVPRHDGAELRFERRRNTSGGSSRPSEIRFASLLSACARATDRPCVATRVHLTCAPFAPTPAHRELFGEIVFNAPFSAMFLDTTTVSRAIPGGCRVLFKQLRQQLLDKAQRPEAPAIGVRVSRDVGNALDDGKPVGISDVAQRLGTSTRSLQRGLTAAGLTYRDIVDRARRDRAAVLLKERSQTLLAIAVALGFSDQASFSRACLRWTGKTPAHYRDTLA